VAQRTREFGLRMALGADSSMIRGLVMRQVALMTVIGALVGLALAMVTGFYAKALLYEMSGIDPAVLAASTIVLALVAVFAGLIPAIRASRVEPMRALRYE
jgi:ABC-type antimicrobial peptide transport system permease subunit